MASPSELSLDCKPHSYSMLLKFFGDQQNDQTEELLSHLEEERLKIDAFKRELPLCMQLLTNAVEFLRQQLQAYKANQGPRPVLEEFIPLKNSTSETSEKSSNISDRANWMTTAQLWSQDSNETKPQPTLLTSPKDNEMGFNVSPKLALDNKQRNGGAFLPFSKERNLCPSPTLALASADKDMMEDKKCPEVENGFSCPKRDNNSAGKVGNNGVGIEQGKGGSNSSSNGHATNTSNGNNTTNTTTTQTHRKARRCWSPDLHRRFVNALQMLGGSQVATPKQIRELMKVDGLTNDEVKSHLQKYRLHTRRPSPSPQAQGAPGTHVVVGIWVPPEYATAAAAAHSGAPTLYGTHPATHPPPPHFCAAAAAAPPVPQDFYTAAAAPPVPQDFYTAAATPPTPLPPHHQLHHHHALHHQLHVYKATSQAHSSPESDNRGTGERSESIEDGKSESSSWKGESGENNGGSGERKGLAALREDGEESNGSEITLKF